MFVRTPDRRGPRGILVCPRIDSRRRAFAHAAIGVWFAGENPPGIFFLFWAIAVVGFTAAGLGVLRAPVLRAAWKHVLAIAAFASSLVCIAFGGVFGLTGFVVDVALLVVAADVLQRRIDADLAVADALGAEVSAHPRWLRVEWAAGLAMLVYVAAVVTIRPLYLRWGTNSEERVAPLPGDDVLSRNARYRVDHGITIHAPASAVWPWLAQLGQDRGGFYSYDWLERAFGVDIRNAERVHPEWQARSVGDTVFATQPSYAGGRFGHLGWRVSALEHERVLVLENWGAFVLRPLDDGTTRLIIRTRGPGDASVAGFVLSPFSVFVFEPAHFIMQRAMLRGIRQRAERAWASSARIGGERQ